MREDFKGFWGTVRGIISESDGTPSSARFTMVWRCFIDCLAVAALVLCVIRGPLDKATLILGALPVLLGALGVWTTATYLTNKVTNIFTKPDPPSPPAPGGPANG